MNSPHLIYRFPKLTLLVLMLLGVYACKQKEPISENLDAEYKVREAISLLADSIAEDGFIGTEQMGRMPGISPAYSRRVRLMEKAKEEELQALTGHPNPIVNLVAFEGLYQSGNRAVPFIFDAFIERSDFIKYIQGDILMEMPMLEYAYVYVLKFPIPDEGLPDAVKGAEPKFELESPKHKEAILRIKEVRHRK